MKKVSQMWPGNLYSLRLLELLEQPIVCPQGEVHCPAFVVVCVGLEVLDDI